MPDLTCNFYATLPAVPLPITTRHQPAAQPGQTPDNPAFDVITLNQDLTICLHRSHTIALNDRLTALIQEPTE